MSPPPTASVPPPAADTRWFTEEVQPHEGDLRKYIHRQFPRLTDVDDVVQESFLRILRANSAGRIACARAYLFTTARNVGYELFRKFRIYGDKLVTDPAVLRIVDDGADVAEKVSSAQEIALLFEAIDRLPSRCREVYILRKIHGLSQRAIAQRLGVSECTVEVQITRGTKKCAQFLFERGVTRGAVEKTSNGHP
jgi:RNA polymerase sigma factor (sigma-70 family)